MCPSEGLTTCSSPLQLGLLCVMVDALAEKADSAHLHDRLADLKRQLPPPMMRLASPAPYALQPISFPGSVRPQPQRAESVEVQGGKTGTKRRERLNTEMVRSPTKTGKKYSQSTSSINLVGASGTTSSSGSRTFTRSTSPKPLLYASESSFSLFPSQNPPGNFSVPSEVLILPISTDMAAIGSLRQKTTLWDFAILSEEEVRRERGHPLNHIHWGGEGREGGREGRALNLCIHHSMYSLPPSLPPSLPFPSPSPSVHESTSNPHLQKDQP